MHIGNLGDKFTVKNGVFYIKSMLTREHIIQSVDSQ